MEKTEGTYSIIYTFPQSATTEAADWSWLWPEEWTHSTKEHCDVQWFANRQFNDRDYQAVLQHFGLEKWPEEFPKEKVRKMSPAKLAAARRCKEKQLGLPKKEMISDTLGSHYRAEEYD